MKHRPSLRLRIEIVLGAVSAALLALTLAVPNWIERFFGFEPDGGDGSAEWGLAISLALATLVLFGDAYRLRARLARARAATK
jgi:hypothetical protein